MARRNRMDIIFDMLLAIQSKGDRIKPTHLMYDANLNHKQLQKYVDELEEKGFVSVQHEDDSRMYVLERKGHLYINKIREMRQFEDAFDI